MTLPLHVAGNMEEEEEEEKKEGEEEKNTKKSYGYIPSYN